MNRMICGIIIYTIFLGVLLSWSQFLELKVAIALHARTKKRNLG